MKEYKKYIEVYNKVENCLYENVIDFNYIKAHIKETKFNKKSENIYYNIGKKYFSYAVINYVLWIVENIKKDNIDMVCFLARDGYIVKECYDLYRNTLDSKLPESRYLYASRSVFYNAAITQREDWSDDLLLNLPNGQDVKSYFLRWNIEENEYLSLLKEYNINSNYIISTKEDRKIIKKIYFELRSTVVKNAKANREILMEYWRNEGLLHKNVAFVDIGWNGTCEGCIEKIIDVEKLNIIPNFYFLGTLMTNKIKKINQDAYKGCFFNVGMPDEISSLIFEGIPIIESFFSAPHSYITRIHKINNKVIPIYDKLEIKENLIYMEYMHKGAISKIIEILKGEEDLERVRRLNIIPLIKLILYPTKKEVQALSSFKVSTTFGTEIYNIPLVRRVRIKNK